MPRAISQFERGRLVALINSGVTQRQVAIELNISVSIFPVNFFINCVYFGMVISVVITFNINVEQTLFQQFI